MARVLLIEDSEVQRDLYRDLLYYNGFDVVVAEDAKAGIAFALDEKPDAILIDVMLPGMNGLIATQNLTRNPLTSHIPIICMSAYDVSEQMVRHSGARELLPKPVSGDVLVRVLRRYLKQRDAQNPPTNNA